MTGSLIPKQIKSTAMLEVGNCVIEENVYDDDEAEDAKVVLHAMEQTETLNDVPVCNELDEKCFVQVNELLRNFSDILTDIPGCTDVKEQF